MNILITNDDGINADGIRELAKTVSKIDDVNVYVVAPDSPRSASGHAITLHKPILINEEYIDENIVAYSISGTPADCVKVGIEALLKDTQIDLVLSGINNGSNLGTDVVYSGTVSAAIEGLIQGKASIAISCNQYNVPLEEYKRSSEYVVKLINSLKDDLDKLHDSILNVNIPTGENKGFKITKLGQRIYENVIEDRTSPRGKRYVWMGGDIKQVYQEPDSDVLAIEEGYISVTPVNIEMTNLKKMNLLKDMGIESI